MSNSSYKQILKSSALIGGSSVIKIVLGAVQGKALALMTGAAGVGLFGAFSAVTTLVGGVASMGIGTSGTRQIAEAVATNDKARIARTILTLRRTSLVLGLAGMAALLIFCGAISRATFKNSSAYAGELAILSVTILLMVVNGAQTALIQGLRQIRNLAASTIWGAVWATVLSIPALYLLREKGVVAFLVLVAALSTAASWWYARKVRVEKLDPAVPALWSEAKVLLGIGAVFMASGLLANAVAYITTVLIIGQMNLEASGFYQAAWKVSGVYVGFILGAMAADFYPRLTAAAANDQEVNRLVNEQTEAALLMALPGILATLTFAPWIIRILNTSEFEPAVEILRWQLLGILGRVICWPMGFVLLAKGDASLYFCMELAANATHVGLIWFGMKWFGLAGLGMAFFGLYIFCVLLNYLVVRWRTGFAWTRSNTGLVAMTLLAAGSVFVATQGRPAPWWGVVLAACGTVASGIYSVRRLAAAAGCATMEEAGQKLLARLRPK